MSDSIERAELLKQSKHCLTADNYATSIPGLMRINMNKLLKQPKYLQKFPQHSYCRFCFTLFRPGNYRIKCKSKIKSNKKIYKLLQKQEKKGKQCLSYFQKRLLDSYEKSTAQVVMKCSCCSKKTTIASSCKPDKIKLKSPRNCDRDDIKTVKSNKKRLKQKLRRAVRAQEEESLQCIEKSGKKTLPDELSIKEEQSGGRVKINTVGIHINDKLQHWQGVPHKGTQASLEKDFSKLGQQTSSSPSNISNKRKKKKKNEHGQTLLKLLEQEKSSKNSNTSALQSFFSSIS